VSNSVAGLYKVIVDIGKLIDAKRRLRGSRVATIPTNFSDGRVILLLPDGSLELTKEQYELLLSRRIDASLSKVVAPLTPGRVNSLELRGRGKTLARVEAPERDYFDYQEVSEDKSREGSVIEGTLNSLSKSSLRGTFYTTDGIHVPYRYTGGDLAQLFQGFSSRESVRVHGNVRFGSDGLPSSLDVESLEPLQPNLLQ